MKKSVIAILLSLSLLTVFLCGCETKTLHCNNCGKESVVNADSQMDESWSLFCEECNEELFGDDPVLGAD